MRILLLISIGLMLGCSSQRAMLKPIDMPDRSTAELLGHLSAQERSYDWIELRAKLKYRDAQESFSGTLILRARRDSLIWMRVSKLGVEGVRVLMNPESGVVMDRIKKKYYRVELDELSLGVGRLPVTFDGLQKLITAQAYLPRDAEFASYPDSQQYVLATTYKGDTVRYYLRASDLLVSEAYLQSDSLQVKIHYDDYAHAERDTSHIWPMHREYTLYTPSDTSLVELRVQSIKTQGPLRFPFQIPPHYERAKP